MDFTQLLAPPSDTEKQQALIAAIGKQRAAAQLGLLTGDRVLGGFGHAMLGDAQKQEETAQRDEAAGSAAGARALAMALAAQEKAKADERQAKRDAEQAAETKVRDDRAERGQVIQGRLLQATLAGLGIRAGADARDAAKDARVEADKAKGEKLPATTVMDLADLPTAKAGIGNLAASFKDLGMSSTAARVSNALPNALGSMLGTDVSKFNDEALIAMQNVGKIMEGGKLAAGDETKYRRMMPRAGMNQAEAERQVAKMQAFLQELYDNRVNALHKQGYNTAGLPAAGATPANPSGTPDIPAAATTPSRTIVRNPKTGERRYLNADGTLGEAVK